ncbi:MULTISPECIES: hypothetical protein [unclassified Corynebacterium]|uniref:hypothetical protein n=1 Tax=unclassified Corynebacterium TaxID=2624378 RepID=UPI00254ADB9B|nr:hypothetical protein [Corynebacterium kefirresidentii]MDK8836934.1 hypothetical protein [Corynebacterium kefirresidentii]
MAEIISLIAALLNAGVSLFDRFTKNDKADNSDKKDRWAEDKERNLDREQRERDRREQLRREDWARQRKAVNNCVAVFREDFPELGNLRIGMGFTVEDADAGFPRYITKGKQLLTFHRKIISSLDSALIEVSNPRVKRAIDQLMEATRKDYAELINAERHSEGEVGHYAMTTNAIGPSMEKALTNLIEVANQQFQNHIT